MSQTHNTFQKGIMWAIMHQMETPPYKTLKHRLT